MSSRSSIRKERLREWKRIERLKKKLQKRSKGDDNKLHDSERGR